jgi:hypothetical protein
MKSLRNLWFDLSPEQKRFLKNSNEFEAKTFRWAYKEYQKTEDPIYLKTLNAVVEMMNECKMSL